MVSRQQHVLILLGVLAGPAFSQPAGKRFYSDDPLWREPPPRAVSQVAVRKVDDIYDFLENSYVTPSREGKRSADPRQALDINTLGEVPDNAWYTNRHWLRRMSIPELERGPGNTSPPSPMILAHRRRQERRCHPGIHHRRRVPEPVAAETRPPEVPRIVLCRGRDRQQVLLRARL